MNNEENRLIIGATIAVIIIVIILVISIVLLSSDNDSDDDYEGGMLEPVEEEYEEDTVTVRVNENNLIRVTLSSSGQNYDSKLGYSSDDYMIYINGVMVSGISDPWFVGWSWLIDSEYTVNSETPVGFESGTLHDVTVSILETVVFNGVIEIP